MKLTKYLNSLLCLASLSILLTGCLGSGDDSETVVNNLYNTIVSSFSMEDNSEVCKNLASYTFTIDNYGTSDPVLHAKFPDDGIIFNPDSLPRGTFPDSIKVNASTTNIDSAFFRLYSVDGKLGQFANFSHDSALYFASYPDARFIVWNGGKSRTYHVKINVHTLTADTIKWNRYTPQLWSNETVTSQRADTIGNTLYWFTERSGAKDQVSTSQMSVYAREWTPQTEVSVPGGDLLDLTTLYSWHDRLYAVAKNSKQLLASADGANWEVANETMTFQAILGNQLKTKDVYGKWNADSLQAIVKEADAYHFATSADGTSWNLRQEIPDNFPISDFSRPISVPAHSKQGNLTSRLYIMGGRTAAGALTSSVWSSDGFTELAQGSNWAEFEHKDIPVLKGATIIEYTRDSDHPKSFWILIPGQIQDAAPTHTIWKGTRNVLTLYYSKDSGVSWHRMSDEYMSCSDTSPLNQNGLDGSVLAATSGICNPNNYEMYFFGGIYDDGTVDTSVWGGDLVSLSFDKIR